MEPLFQNLTNGGGTWKEHEVPLSKVFDRVKGIALGTPVLWDYFLEELPRALASGQISAGAEPQS
jgi:putative hydrolase of HD superfamily